MHAFEGSPSSALLENPFPFYAMGRRGSPHRHAVNRQFWSAFGYRDCAAVLRDSGSWSSLTPRSPGSIAAVPSMMFSDPPRHSHLRRLASQALAPKNIARLEPKIRSTARTLVEATLQADQPDLIEMLALPLPLIIIADILGIPHQDRNIFRQWSSEIVDHLGGEFALDSLGTESNTIAEIDAYFRSVIEHKRTTPTDDFISRLTHFADGLEISELVQMFLLILVAGHETTKNLIGNTILELLSHPTALDLIKDDSTMLDTTIEEVLRYSSPVQAIIRRANRDVELNGKVVIKGQYMVVWLGSANRDPDIFEHADEFQVTRTPNHHLAFGLGIHHCLGAPLARLETKVALEELLPWLEHIRRPNNIPLPRPSTFTMRGVRSLPVEFEARRAPSQL